MTQKFLGFSSRKYNSFLVIVLAQEIKESKFKILIKFINLLFLSFLFEIALNLNLVNHDLIITGNLELKLKDIGRTI